MEKKPRPRKLPNVTESVTTGCGDLDVTTTYLDGEIFEVFAHMENANSCMRSQTESVCRLLSSARRYGVPMDGLVKQLNGVRCGKIGFSKEDGKVLSCADGIAKVLRRRIDDNSSQRR